MPFRQLFLFQVLKRRRDSSSRIPEKKFYLPREVSNHFYSLLEQSYSNNCCKILTNIGYFRDLELNTEHVLFFSINNPDLLCFYCSEHAQINGYKCLLSTKGFSGTRLHPGFPPISLVGEEHTFVRIHLV